MKISQREMVLGVATLAVLLIGGSWYAINGKLAAWKAMKPEMARLQNEIVRHEAAIKMQGSWEGDLEELQKDLLVYDTGQRSVSPELMKTINAISNKHELEITRTNPYAEKPTGNLFELGINCTWQGSLDALVGFLTELQQQGIRYDVRTLNIQPMGKNTGKLKGNMIIDCAYTRQANG
ncbi:MAG: hypothetical protein JXR25_10780 [Pontiellaceae bacterium]|nr:hypothetical protein [Pontiellaceae bacterium]MBN2785305.1 hypothetical protein [Pontiellaceae bacterium]